MKEQEIKALFLSQYLWQNVEWGSSKAKGQLTYLRGCDVDNTILISTAIALNATLLLRSVSQLTDKERTFLAMCVFEYYSDIDYGKQKNILINVSKLDTDIFLNDYQVNIHNTTGTISFVYDGKDYLVVPVIVYQYLLRIGILLPFTYLNENNQPVTLQPDEIIAKGWAKLV